jgi:UPF0271 protein
MKSIDINCDMGEGMDCDLALMDLVSSINIACGFHAGDVTTMARTIEGAIARDLAIGVHPSYPDRENFGRVEPGLSPKEIFDIVVYQVAAIKGMCEARNARLRHVKPHGALYNTAAADRTKARAIADAVKSVDGSLILYGLAGSYLISEASAAGLRAANEAFADRTYTDDGSLTPRSEPNSLISDPEEMFRQVRRMVEEGVVVSANGKPVALHAETICVHGDGPHAVEFASTLKSGLAGAGIKIEPPF